MSPADAVRPAPAPGLRATPRLPAGARRRAPERTRERLLDAAERLFAQRGFDGASLRAVTRAAGTSVSAAHYHFGSKRALLRAALRRRVEPINRRRLEALAAAERAARGGPPALESVLDAFLRPLFEARAEGRDDPADPARFVAARLYLDPPDVVAAMKRELFGEVSRRFLEVLGRTLPERRPEELALALQFLIGIVVHVAGGHLDDAPALESEPAAEGLLADSALLRHTIAFVAAGLRAPAPHEEEA